MNYWISICFFYLSQGWGYYKISLGKIFYLFFLFFLFSFQFIVFFLYNNKRKERKWFDKSSKKFFKLFLFFFYKYFIILKKYFNFFFCLLNSLILCFFFSSDLYRNIGCFFFLPYVFHFSPSIISRKAYVKNIHSGNSYSRVSFNFRIALCMVNFTLFLIILRKICFIYMSCEEYCE